MTLYVLRLIGTVFVSMSFFSGCSQAIDCPNNPLGVSYSTVDGEVSYTSVARAEALSDSEESKSLAADQAKMAARNQLAKYKTGFNLKQLTLSGVVDTSVCNNGRMVYAAVVISQASVDKGRMLKNDIGRSMQSIPTPQPDSF